MFLRLRLCVTWYLFYFSSQQAQELPGYNYGAPEPPVQLNPSRPPPAATTAPPKAPVPAGPTVAPVRPPPPPPPKPEGESGSKSEGQDAPQGGHHHDSADPLAWLRDSVPGMLS